MKKGSQVMVEGRMQTRSWDDQATNTKKYRTEVIADRVQFGSNSGGAKSGGSFDQSSSPKNAQSQDKDEGSLDTIEYPEEQINAEDIPF
jgi:single-strand DNA-binding protein